MTTPIGSAQRRSRRRSAIASLGVVAALLLAAGCSKGSSPSKSAKHPLDTSALSSAGNSGSPLSSGGALSSGDNSSVGVTLRGPGFTTKLPKGWKKTSPPDDDPGDVAARSPDGGFLLITETSAGGVTDLDAAAHASIENLKKDGNTYNDDEDDDTWDHTKAKTFSALSSDGSLVNGFVVMLHGGQYYTLVFGIDASKKDSPDIRNLKVIKDNWTWTGGDDTGAGDSGSALESGDESLSSGGVTTGIAADATFTPPSDFSLDTKHSTADSQQFQGPNDSGISWPACSYTSTSDTASATTKCLNSANLGTLTLDPPTPQTFGGVDGTTQQATTQKAPQYHLLIACLPTQAGGVECALFFAPTRTTTGDPNTLLSGEQQAFLTAVGQLGT